MDIKAVPSTIEEAVETLLAYYAEDIPVIRSRTEEDFLALAHLGGGMFMRNSWCLFWNEKNRHSSWSVEKPPLVQWFNDRGIKDADDMSDEILQALWRRVNGLSNE